VDRHRLQVAISSSTNRSNDATTSSINQCYDFHVRPSVCQSRSRLAAFKGPTSKGRGGGSVVEFKKILQIDPVSVCSMH